MEALGEFLHTLCADYASLERVFTHFMRELCKPWRSFYKLYAQIMQALGHFLHTLCANYASLERVFTHFMRELCKPWASFYTLYARIMQAMGEFLHTLCVNHASLGRVFTHFMREFCKPWASFYSLKALLEPARRPKECAGRPAGMPGEDARTGPEVIKKRILGKSVPRRRLPAPCLARDIPAISAFPPAVPPGWS